MVVIAPVLLIMWRRPEATKRALAQIREAKPQYLYVASDGFQPGDERTKRQVIACRDMLNRSVDWDCTVYKQYADRNYGCRDGVANALDWFFANEDRGIIVEDDIICSSTFFTFASELLELYQDDKRIGSISANSYGLKSCKYDSKSYGFTIYPHIWGWATWARVWKQYDRRPSLCGIAGLAFSIAWNQGILAAIFWIKTFIDVRHEKVDTWDYQLAYLFFKNRLLSIRPTVELAENIGFNKDASHTTDSFNGCKERNELMGSICHPTQVMTCKERDSEVFAGNFMPDKAISRLVNRLKDSVRL